MTLAIVTDSTAQISPELAETLGVEVVPITITIDGVDHREGIDLDADGFAEAYVEGVSTVTTAAPSAGAIAEVYARVVDEGATGIVSIHVGADQSATCRMASLAAELVDVPVEIVDTGLASFGVAMAVIEAVVRRIDSTDPVECATAVRAMLPSIGTVFVLDTGALPERSGRFAAMGADLTEREAGVPVYFLGGGRFEEVGVAATEEEATALMADRIIAARPSSIASAIAPQATSLTAELDARLRAAGHPLMHYRVGPSVAAHAGLRSAGAFFVAGPDGG